MTRPCAAPAALLLALLPAQLAAQQGDASAGRLRNVEIRTRDVFTDEEAEHNLFYWFSDALHAVTRQYVIERENFLQPGDELTAARVAELERNLRATGLFGGVAVTARPAGDGQADLVVDTRDHFSLNVSASLTRVGGVYKYGLRASDSNLLGTGK